MSVEKGILDSINTDTDVTVIDKLALNSESLKK